MPPLRVTPLGVLKFPLLTESPAPAISVTAWLNDHEDPNPAKAEQYARWHHLRDLHNASFSQDKN